MPDRIRSLHRLTAKMLRDLDLASLGSEIARTACTLESADAAALLLVDPATDSLRIVAHEGLSDAYAGSQQIPMDRARAMYQGFDVHVAIDLRATPLGDARLIAEEGLERVIAVPLVRDSELIGGLIIYAKDRTREFDAMDIELLHILAAQAAIAITNARLYAAEHDARRLREAIFEALSDGVLVAYPDGRFEANRAASEMFGDTGAATLSELRAGVDLREETSGESVRDEEAPLEQALRGDRAGGRFLLRNATTGVERVVKATAQPLLTGGRITGGVLVLNDLTAQRDSDRQKDQFLSIVSHELKTPLTPLKALAQLLRARLRRHRTEGKALDLDSFEKNLLTIERQVDRMNGLVNDLLEVSRAGQGRFQLQRSDMELMAMVRDVMQRYVDQTEEDGRYRFTTKGPERLAVLADPARLEQVLMNLVGNAVKYSPAGGPIDVAVSREDGFAAVTVRDQGIGIPAEDLSSLARPFARGSARAQTFAGMGIGLFLSKLVAEGHGGTLQVQSGGADQGTTVTFTIPAA
ncbi:MAG TPA: ATP-binding protein [Candidatus Saccharimonadales bacterium]|nr:ATP-binding protein [Candidatus Saccharimonadales bacterium]